MQRVAVLVPLCNSTVAVAWGGGGGGGDAGEREVAPARALPPSFVPQRPPRPHSAVRMNRSRGNKIYTFANPAAAAVDPCRRRGRHAHHSSYPVLYV